ncbi:MAG: hypothetical protein ACR2L1_06430 [Pyrinomonadaceae bacterium]
MRLDKFKKTIMAFAIGLIALLGSSQFASAQTRRQVKRQKQVYKQQQKIRKQQQKIARQRQIHIQQQRQIQRRQTARQYNRYRVYNNGRYYNTDSRGAELLRQSVNNGYRQGIRAGQYDRTHRIRRSYTINSTYRRGNYGYRSYVDSRQYQYYFRQGFQRGYQDGYSRNYRYGTNNSSGFNILGSILSSILNIRRY